ncbi:N-acetylmuramoyl-L-alanine amidase [Streptosporangium sp. NBC_01756]|uniref:N-acetylmuramoyl-L-alanine amidase n=1 Tax=Streptosporangium sp. NBC_01756 TaxID=2975950 RepID=UPI002DDBBB0F|nr:N-acetylmuramoyl-L-alanine amidase [Streptosporangium sp. NBC_01756]WSC85817.1 N-acetylmuramoyl-L-alanine amidase [Streptosporangium sp. NBC_01756]
MQLTRMRMSCRLTVILSATLTILLGVLGQSASAAPAAPLTDAFARAATAYDVPRDLLVALAYAETHLDGHDGRPSASGGYGVMHLVSNPTTHALEQAAKITGKSLTALRTDDAANILGGAAVLRAHADELGLDAAARKDAGRWYEAVAGYGNASSPEVARLYADTVYDFLGRGVQAPVRSGEVVTVRPREIRPDLGGYARTPDLNAQVASADYPSASWVAASSSNYTVAGRPSTYAIDRVVIHVTQGSYAGTISWFQNPAAQVTAHYVVRSSDGAVTQMVREKDVAWHAGNWSYNTRSIGIEHEGYVSDASWFTDAMYRASAALTRNICDRYGIPKDRAHIIGHVEVPGADHTDPGSYWDWTKYMQYVTGGTTPPPAKYWVDTFAAAPGHSSPGGTQTGTLNQGTNYVYCRTWGPNVQVGADYNHWWLKTDLDSGSPWQNQWVSAYYLARWGNDVAKDNSGNDIRNC